ELVEAVKPVKADRTYPFEYFVQGDWDEVRNCLKPEYRWLSNKQLMHQACNLRKAGKLQVVSGHRCHRRFSRGISAGRLRKIPVATLPGHHRSFLNHASEPHRSRRREVAGGEGRKRATYQPRATTGALVIPLRPGCPPILCE